MSNNSTSSVSEIISIVTNSTALLVCLLAAILVFVLRLYNKVVYRLGLYQVLAALAFASMEVLGITLVSYVQPKSKDICFAIGWLNMYSRWVKLFFTVWVTFHLYCFAVFHENLKKLEVLYVVTSLLVPVAIAAVPLITRSYGVSMIGGCYVYASNGSQQLARIERFALWDGPAMLILLATSAAMVAMVIRLAYRVCWRFKYEPITEGDQFWMALKQLLPLAAFPILFAILVIPEFIFHIFEATRPTIQKELQAFASVSISLWSMASGATLLVHISLARLCGRKPQRKETQGKELQYHSSHRPDNVVSETAVSTNSATWFSVPNSS